MKSATQHCTCCGLQLCARQNKAGLLLVCNRQQCSNYWVREGAEIIMMLK